MTTRRVRIKVEYTYIGVFVESRVVLTYYKRNV